MIYTHLRFLLFTGIILMGAGLSQCETRDPGEDIILEVSGNGYSNFHSQKTTTIINNLPVETLSDDETEGLVFLREEEKLARDLNINFSNQYQNQIFENISNSEETHMDAIKVLLDKYEINDPVKAIGSFSNEDLAESYNNFNEIGNQSIIDALKVGAEVEEINILNLEEQINDITNNQDITLIYRNLRISSKNHLRAFVRIIEEEGDSYGPRHLPQTQYLDIVNSDFENGVKNNE